METVVIQSIPPKQTSLVTKSSRVKAISLFRPISPSIPIRKVFINRVGTMATPELVRRGSYHKPPTVTPPSPLFCTPPSSPESDRSSPWSTTTSNTQSSSTCVESPSKSRVVSTFVQRELNLSQISINTGELRADTDLFHLRFGCGGRESNRTTLGGQISDLLGSGYKFNTTIGWCVIFRAPFEFENAPLIDFDTLRLIRYEDRLFERRNDVRRR